MPNFVIATLVRLSILYRAYGFNASLSMNVGPRGGSDDERDAREASAEAPRGPPVGALRAHRELLATSRWAGEPATTAEQQLACGHARVREAAERGVPELPQRVALVAQSGSVSRRPVPIRTLLLYPTIGCIVCLIRCVVVAHRRFKSSTLSAQAGST